MPMDSKGQGRGPSRAEGRASVGSGESFFPLCLPPLRSPPLGPRPHRLHSNRPLATRATAAAAPLASLRRCRASRPRHRRPSSEPYTAHHPAPLPSPLPRSNGKGNAAAASQRKPPTLTGGSAAPALRTASEGRIHHKRPDPPRQRPPCPCLLSPALLVTARRPPRPHRERSHRAGAATNCLQQLRRAPLTASSCGTPDPPRQRPPCLCLLSPALLVTARRPPRPHRERSHRAGAATNCLQQLRHALLRPLRPPAPLLRLGQDRNLLGGVRSSPRQDRIRRPSVASGGCLPSRLAPRCPLLSSVRRIRLPSPLSPVEQSEDPSTSGTNSSSVADRPMQQWTIGLDNLIYGPCKL
ncbi:hypothetical protein U9M48_003442 [Paspalum notatum var. saurae]|uniref:Uncharacterized protein n=1 Tax=Paspalum notatum var. saurae TaxID=547442 RepID=A0AAQ3SE19_PASNO